MPWGAEADRPRSTLPERATSTNNARNINHDCYLGVHEDKALVQDQDLATGVLHEYFESPGDRNGDDCCQFRDPSIEFRPAALAARTGRIC